MRYFIVCILLGISTVANSTSSVIDAARHRSCSAGYELQLASVKTITAFKPQLFNKKEEDRLEKLKLGSFLSCHSVLYHSNGHSFITSMEWCAGRASSAVEVFADFNEKQKFCKTFEQVYLSMEKEFLLNIELFAVTRGKQ